MPAEEFFYANRGKSVTVSGVNDKEDFHILHQSFQWLGFSSIQLSALFKLLAAILHLGNVAVLCHMGIRYQESSYIDPESKEITLASKLLGLSAMSLCKWLCNKKIITKHECLIKPINLSQVAE